MNAKKGSKLAARVTVLECFDKPRFDQAGSGIRRMPLRLIATFGIG